MSFAALGRRRYNRAVPRADGRRIGIAILAVLLAVGLALGHAPFELGNLRVAGVSLLWWYAFGIAPTLAAVTAAFLLWRSG